MRIDEELIDAVVIGGCFLGGGGGGDPAAGRRMGRLALDVGLPRFISLDEMPDDAVIVTVSAVGAPAAVDQFCTPMNYVHALELLRKDLGRVDGLITSENGGLASTNGWFQSAVTGIPVVDAPCNGRAHPTGMMGAIGLHQEDGYVSRQAAAGGNPDLGLYTEIITAAGIAEASRLLRQAAVSAGGMVAVARNPVTAKYVRTHAAPGALSQAIELGHVILSKQKSNALETAKAAADFMDGQVAVEGIVERIDLETRNGFDVGVVLIRSGGDLFEMSFWNEYMTLDSGGKRLATFPDLMATVDLDTDFLFRQQPLQRGNRVAVVTVPKSRLILGAGMKDSKLIEEAERIVERPMLDYFLSGG